MHEAEALLGGPPGRERQIELPAPDPERAGIRGVVAGENLDEGRLPRSVLPDECMNLARIELQPEVAQSAACRETSSTRLSDSGTAEAPPSRATVQVLGIKRQPGRNCAECWRR